MPAIKTWLESAERELKAIGITSARLDAEIILAHTIRKNRTYLHAHHDQLLESRQLEIADARLQLRKDRTPLAYITGHKEFYGRRFKVTPATLIPRPESETIITLLKKLASSPKQPTPRLVDVGTGTGCLGITAKLELPQYDVTLLDTSRHALHVAGINAKHHNVSVQLLQSNLLQAYPFEATVIIANLPYVDPEWERSPETNYEPEEALFASDNGLSLIYKLLKQLPSHLVDDGIALIEADPRQYHALTTAAEKEGFEVITSVGFITALRLHSFYTHQA